ncbi:peroxiredoxin [Acetobacter senegalensis]|uniref:Alkyl hydroperoxide reductase C n=2 Tax=Acetobacter TaxID=434 RepID=A0A0U5EWB3_9PROT|nr:MULTISPECIES: peroxiredoxin [Acetobacter]ATJ90148.1 peroxiredoxin [Acetobacter tropicalis]KXV56554.1 peroxiredoxin [Acetobacter senegalensis]MCC6104991.1 peroxiredoxin [Acetobacter sp.]MCG4258597.1 peroxiredoxin [Acetobacter senegalensis]MCG4261421.1 peroxiredoxin [Acetobacter senegalensis]
MSDQTLESCPLYHSRAILQIGDAVPDFVARTTQGELTFSSLRGHWVMLFAHPADFTPVCTSEFIALARAAPQFQALNCALVGLSVDSLPSHLAWVEAIRERFGVSIPFPIVEDPSMSIARAYGMLDTTAQSSVTVRAVYVIDPEGIVQAVTWYPPTVGRSVKELLRLLKALQQVAQEDVLTPEGWQPGEPVMYPAAQTQDAVAEAGPAWFMPVKPEKKG